MKIVKNLSIFCVLFGQRVSTATIALCASLNSVSHLRPIIATGLALLDNHHVTLIGTHQVIEKARPLGGHQFQERPMADCDMLSLLQPSGDTLPLGAREFMEMLGGRLTYKLAERIRGARKRVGEVKPDVMIVDMFAVGCLIAADELDIPVVLTTTALHGAIVSTPAWVTKSFEHGSLTTEHQSLLSRLLELPKMVSVALAMKHVEDMIRDYLIEHGLAPKGVFELMNAIPTAVIANTFYPLELSFETNPNIGLVGPMTLDQRKDSAMSGHVKEFLDERKSVIYIALGQHLTFPRRDQEVVIRSLKMIMDEGLVDGVIWIIKDHDVKQYTTDPRFMLEKWTSQAQVLEHASTKLFISHCGGDSTMEGIMAGVPILGVPFVGDQPTNGQKLVRLGVSEILPIDEIATNEEIFLSHLRKLITHSTYHQNMQNLSTIAHRQSKIGPAKAASMVETIIHFGPDALKNYGLRMNWLKRNNYDLIMVLGMILVILVWGMVKVGRMMGLRGLMITWYKGWRQRGKTRKVD